MARSVKVVGHRGAAGLLPENTLAGFRRAIELGVDAVECDVRLSADGELVLMHDATVDRTTNGSGAVGEMDLEALLALDAGGGEPPPTFEYLLDTVVGKCELFCELKGEETGPPAAEAVAARATASDVLFVSFSRERAISIREVIPDARLGLLASAPKTGDIEFAREMGFESLGMHYRSVSPATAREVLEAGLQLSVWTVNRPEHLRAMLSLGVDVITTDRPDVLMRPLGR